MNEASVTRAVSPVLLSCAIRTCSGRTIIVTA
jgi:hypothetical protein